MNKDAVRKHHDLKSIPQHFKAVACCDKSFEIRFNDRDFQVGDSVTLREYIPEEDRYTGAVLSAFIGHLTNYAQKDGYVVFSLVRIGISII